MAYEHKSRGAGDVILSADWNAMGDEIQRLADLLEQDEKKETVSLPIPLRVFGKGAPLSPLSVAGGAAIGAGYADKHAAPADGMIVQGKVGIGTPAPRAGLEVDRGATNDLALRLTSTGPGWGSGLQLENRASGGRSYGIYSGGGKLHLCDVEAGTDRLVVDGAGNVGIGTSEPSHALHVRTGDSVGLFESTGGQAYLRIATKEGMDNRVELANRPGGRLALWVAGGSDALNVTRSGTVGIGTTDPQDRLEVKGPVRILTDSNPVRFTSGWSGFPDGPTNQAEISNDTATYKTLMIVGNRSAGVGRRVSVWDRLEVNGSLEVTGKMRCRNAREMKAAANKVDLAPGRWATVPDMSLSLETEENPVLMLFKTGGVQIVGVANGRAHFRLMVDGKQVAITVHEFHNGGWELRDISLSWVGTLSKGKHTANVDWYVEGGTLSCCWYGDTRNLIAIEL